MSRHAVYDWMNKNPEYKAVLDDARGEFLDDVLSTARVVALGIPLKDDQGNFAGYQVPPDGSMLRYLMSTLGRNEGFGEQVEVKQTIKRQYEKEEAEMDLKEMEKQLYGRELTEEEEMVMFLEVIPNRHNTTK